MSIAIALDGPAEQVNPQLQKELQRHLTVFMLIQERFIAQSVCRQQEIP